jgi:hypothetical protein
MRWTTTYVDADGRVAEATVSAANIDEAEQETERQHGGPVLGARVEADTSRR